MKFAAPQRGRRPKYCSQACRQKAYRRRASNPQTKLKLLFQSDLYKIRDLTARRRAAIKVLNELGYKVYLKPLREKPTKSIPNLKLISNEGNSDVCEPE